MRLDSPAVISTAGTLAIHVVLALIGSELIVALPPRAMPEPPRVELVEIEPPAILLPPPPPPPAPAIREPEPERPAPEERRPAPRPRVAPEAPSADPPKQPEVGDPAPDPGGAPVTTMEDIAPAATGVAVAKGPRSTGPIGRGGTGTGTGSGDGAGSAEVRPVSVATIKTRALPRGDFSYFDAGKDYPPQARQLGIEGIIRVRLVVDEEGRVKSAVLLNRLGHGLDELALARARQIEFVPARDTDDRAVTSVVVWTFNMTLPK